MAGTAAPAWLGTRLLTPVPGKRWGQAEPTPPELVDRQLWTEDHLAPPTDDAFVATRTSPPPAEVVARSTWSAGCPVTLDELTYLTVSFFGFDGLTHTGELLVNAAWADDITRVFEGLYAQRFPIEEMRVVRTDELLSPPTGDGNNTTSFVCRPSVGSANSWSRHALGLAIDINPFHNPYKKADLVLPELSSAYLDRTTLRPGMIGPEQAELFEEFGWGWGGEWNSALDFMHFSDNHR